MASPQPVLEDFEVVVSPEQPTILPSEKESDEKKTHEPEASSDPENQHRASFASPETDNHPVAPGQWSSLQTLAKMAVLGHLPLVMAGGLLKVIIEQRDRIRASPNPDDDIFDVAAVEVQAVLQRGQDGFRWIDNELPRWLDRQAQWSGEMRDRVARSSKSLGSSVRSRRHAAEDGSGRRPRRRNRESGRGFRRLRLFVAGVLVLQAANWMFTWQSALFRWTIGLKVPVWLTAVIVWTLFNQRRHRSHDEGEYGISSDVD